MSLSWCGGGTPLPPAAVCLPSPSPIRGGEHNDTWQRWRLRWPAFAVGRCGVVYIQQRRCTGGRRAGGSVCVCMFLPSPLPPFTFTVCVRSLSGVLAQTPESGGAQAGGVSPPFTVCAHSWFEVWGSVGGARASSPCSPLVGAALLPAVGRPCRSNHCGCLALAGARIFGGRRSYHGAARRRAGWLLGWCGGVSLAFACAHSGGACHRRSSIVGRPRGGAHLARACACSSLAGARIFGRCRSCRAVRVPPRLLRGGLQIHARRCVVGLVGHQGTKKTQSTRITLP